MKKYFLIAGVIVVLLGAAVFLTFVGKKGPASFTAAPVPSKTVSPSPSAPAEKDFCAEAAPKVFPESPSDQARQILRLSGERFVQQAKSQGVTITVNEYCAQKLAASDMLAANMRLRTPGEAETAVNIKELQIEALSKYIPKDRAQVFVEYGSKAGSTP